MVLTRDMGPLLIAGYASGAFLAASVAMWWHLRSGQRWTAFVLAVGLFGLWIGAVTWALFALGSVDGVAAERLESLAAPFASSNDQLALVTWFQRATPAAGLRPRRRAVVRLRARAAAAAACRRRSTATTPSPRSSACSAPPRPGRRRSAARSGCIA